MHVLNYTAAFDISDYETVTKNHSIIFSDYEEALSMAFDLYHGDFGPERFYNIRLNGEDPFFHQEPEGFELPF